MTMRDGHYLSIYSFANPMAHVFDMGVRHDQCMALWCKTGRQVELKRYWEFERLSGLKHHGVSFYDTDHLINFINARISEFGLTYRDLEDVWGTPGLGRDPHKTVTDTAESIAYHSLTHLYSSLLCDTEVFRNEPVLSLALDGGPDTIIQKNARRKFYYAGAYSAPGRDISFFPISSPGPLWSGMRGAFGLAEGSLMALASASTAQLISPSTGSDIPTIRNASEASDAQLWFQTLLDRVNGIAEDDEGISFQHRDERFSFEDDKISMVAKEVQEASKTMLARTVESAIERYGLVPDKTVLAMSGGFALNCPTNTFLMQEFGFKAFQSVPVVNDSGMSLGLGLMNFYEQDPEFEFRLSGPFQGASPTAPIPATISTHIKESAPAGPDEIIDDVIESPTVFLSGAAEIGPRALGHRSILGDPRTLRTRDTLNMIKQRQWWRPVAPMILEEHVHDWFEDAHPSPYMLHVFKLREDRREQAPAILHLDGTARVQTVSKAESSALHALLSAFYARTGVPILCNTSLNDRGEPNIQTLPEAMNFALRKGLNVVHCDGIRYTLQGHDAFGETLPGRRQYLDEFFHHAWYNDTERARLNPCKLSHEQMVVYFLSNALWDYDLNDPAQAKRLIKWLNIYVQKFQNTLTSDYLDGFHGVPIAAKDVLHHLKDRHEYESRNAAAIV